MSDEDIERELKSLPDTLDKTYVRCLERAQTDQIAWKYCRRVLFWTACAFRPLSPSELQEAISIDEMHDIWEASKIVTDSPIHYGGNLIEEDAVRGACTFVHPSVKQFLEVSAKVAIFKQASVEHSSSDIDTFSTIAKKYCSHLCLKYLGFKDFAAQMVRRETVSSEMPTRKVFESIEATLSESPIARLGAAFLKRSRTASAAPKVRPILTRPKPTLGEESLGEHPQKYRCLSYLREYWPAHTRESHDSAAAATLILPLMQSMNYTFRLQPWVQPGMNHEQYSKATILDAMQNDYPHLLRALSLCMSRKLVLKMITTELPDSQLHPIHLAMYLGNLGCVEYLCSLDADRQLSLADKLGNTAIHFSAISGTVVDRQYFYRRTTRQELCQANANGDTPIILAARHGQFSWISTVGMKLRSTVVPKDRADFALMLI